MNDFMIREFFSTQGNAFNNPTGESSLEAAFNQFVGLMNVAQNELKSVIIRQAGCFLEPCQIPKDLIIRRLHTSVLVTAQSQHIMFSVSDCDEEDEERVWQAYERECEQNLQLQLKKLFDFEGTASAPSRPPKKVPWKRFFCYYPANCQMISFYVSEPDNPSIPPPPLLHILELFFPGTCQGSIVEMMQPVSQAQWDWFLQLEKDCIKFLEKRK